MRGKLLEINIQNFVYRWNGAEAANQKVYGVAIMNSLFGGAIPTHEKSSIFVFKWTNSNGSSSSISSILP